MTARRALRFLALVVTPAAVLLASSCGHKHVTQPATDIPTLIDRAGEVPDPDVYHDDSSTAEHDSTINGEHWVCTVKTHHIAEAPLEFPKFDPNAEVIWPGAALQGGTISSPTPGR